MIPRTFRKLPARIAFIDGDEGGGGSSAPDETPAPETPAEDAPAEEVAAEEAPAAEEESEGMDAQSLDDLPAWARAEVKRLRAENAKRRTTNTELTEKLATAKSPEEFEAAVSELQAANAQLERDATVAKLQHQHGLDDDVVALLEDVPTDKLADRAAALARLATGGVERDPSGGLTPDAGGDGFDPVKAAREHRSRRRY
ncbi:hypothetical protein [Cellulosimicrobium sp. TH-20]|uniref:hypothetical protein n=1 Tax=Cellulosimicrobium sp. TH-20 TaxID=1980001 RepID=UPI0011A475EF|nr:hypothetical protein [Cellulosimicrobium sp. TH-20]